MKDHPARAKNPDASRVAAASGYALIAGAVVLAWQIVLQPVIHRAPPAVAVRIAPASPLVLSRAAESELTANRPESAALLAREALARAPFNARALRIVGLAEARAGRTEAADELLTLAGNWSLRDDPSHAWLIERRLRQGSYTSAFAHADTLLRRREDLWPQIFKLFETAATSDAQRAIPPIAALLEANAPWRLYFLNSLYRTPDGLRVAMALALMLEESKAPLSNIELSQLYGALLSANLVPAIKALRTELGRPAAGLTVTNGAFSDLSAPAPFQWELVQSYGNIAEITEDEGRPGETALWVQYDGYSDSVLARQLVLLSPGRYRFGAAYRAETSQSVDRMTWRVTCIGSGGAPLTISALPEVSSGKWSSTSTEFSIEADCPAQWLELVGRSRDHRQNLSAWFDDVAVRPAEPVR
ncbi:hypothetical protein [Brevundimonas sp. FT23042]|uniref:hypothetical protein n=1 Tax=Brevundimonas sp. FT23042 TaxID=3393749 RepID=UPI003B585ADF